MTDEKNIIQFKDHKIRRKWDEKIQDYYFSVIDVVGALSESKNPRDYWYRLKKTRNGKWH